MKKSMKILESATSVQSSIAASTSKNAIIGQLSLLLFLFAQMPSGQMYHAFVRVYSFILILSSGTPFSGGEERGWATDKAIPRVHHSRIREER